MGKEDAEPLKRVFSYFTKKLRMRKPDDKRLKILLQVAKDLYMSEPPTLLRLLFLGV